MNIQARLRDLNVGDTFRFLGGAATYELVADIDDCGCVGYAHVQSGIYNETPASETVLAVHRQNLNN